MNNKRIIYKVFVALLSLAFVGLLSCNLLRVQQQPNNPAPREPTSPSIPQQPTNPPTLSDDHSNRAFSATMLLPGTPVQGSIETLGDVDWFTIQTEETGTFTVFSTGSTDTVVQVYRELSPIALSDNEGSASNFSYTHTDRPAAFHFRVSESGNDSTGEYSIQLNFISNNPDDDHGDTPESATAIALGVPTHGVIENSYDDDWFSVEVTETGILTVYTTGNVDTLGEIRHPDGRQLNIGNNEGEGRNFRMVTKVTAGTYFIEVITSLVPSQISTGAYAIQADFTTTFPDDHSDNWGSATTLNLGSPTNGNIEFREDIDWFSVETTEAGILTVYTTGSIATFGVLQAENGSQIVTSGYGGEGENFHLSYKAPAGRYYIQVSARGGYTGAYTVWANFIPLFLDDHSDDRSSATLFALNDSVNGSIEVIGDEDWFRIEITEAGTLALWTRALAADVFGRLYRGTSDVAVASDDNSEGRVNFRISERLTAGTYYLQVTINYPSVGRYFIKADFTPE